jgi:hypothetical protein
LPVPVGMAPIRPGFSTPPAYPISRQRPPSRCVGAAVEAVWGWGPIVADDVVAGRAGHIPPHGKAPIRPGTTAPQKNTQALRLQNKAGRRWPVYCLCRTACPSRRGFSTPQAIAFFGAHPRRPIPLALAMGILPRPPGSLPSRLANRSALRGWPPMVGHLPGSLRGREGGALRHLLSMVTPHLQPAAKSV